MLRLLIQKTAWQLDTEGEFSASDKVSMCNYWANRLCCEAADRAMQVHGGLGYSRHKPFEHIYRHHRRYRITEGAEEIQMRRVAGYLFGFMGQKSPKGVAAAELTPAGCAAPRKGADWEPIRPIREVSRCAEPQQLFRTSCPSCPRSAPLPAEGRLLHGDGVLPGRGALERPPALHPSAARGGGAAWSTTTRPTSSGRG